ncbi:MAG: DUF2807 domain-containing protein [Muribaculaceae bacterium]|nr:DUF2807 domain-containing protein [Muribaculaceae bacterium]
MKRLILSLLIALCAVTSYAQEDINNTQNVTLLTAQPFDEILVNGDVTVECVFNPEYHRYVVYRTENESAQRIECRNENNRLIIDGNNELNDVASRIIVFCNDSLKAVIMNGSGNLVIKETPRLNHLHVIQNANGNIKIGDLKAYFLSIVNNNTGSVYAKDTKARRLSVVSNGSGEMKLKSIKAYEGLFVSNGSADITLADILVRQASFTVNSSGNFKLSGKTGQLTLITNGPGNIDTTDLSYKSLKQTR